VKNKKDQKPLKHQNRLKRTNSKIQKQKVVSYVYGKLATRHISAIFAKGANQTNQKHTGLSAAQANLTEDTKVFCAVTLEVSDASGTYQSHKD